MTSHSRAEVFETITEQLREHKIVTFKWLSRTLKLHNTLAREYLEEWTKNCSRDEYIISYMVFGRKDDGELLFILTADITDEHFSRRNITVVKKYVYSIQSSDISFEPSLIYNMDKASYELQQMSLSSINYPFEIIRKDPKAAGHSQNDARRISPRKKNEASGENSQQKNERIESSNSGKTLPRENCSGIESEKSHDKDSTKDVNKMKQISSKKPKPNKAGVASRSITNFFGKNTATKETRDEPKEIEAENSNEIENNSDEPVKIEKHDTSRVENVNGKESKPKIPIKTQRKMKNRKADKKTNKKGKQMKRILTPLDSDSDDESDNSDTSIDNDEVPVTAAASIAVEEPEPEPRVIAVEGKKMKRKMIEEEGEEDGFMVTIKKVVYESCDSADESEEPSAAEKPLQNIAPPQKKSKTELLTKKKQSSILSFFQKPKASKA